MGGRGVLLCALVWCVLLSASMPASAAYEGSRSAQPAPDPQIDRTPTTVRVPALMYHHISEVPADASALRRDLTVTPSAFRAQLAWLRDHGYTTVDANDVWEAMFEGLPLPPRPVMLTFDDGYDDAYRIALPLLREFRAVGVFFVVVDLLGRDGYMTRDQVRALADAGMDIESHGMDHINMSKLSSDQQRAQFCGSRAILSLIAGRPVRHFAYPNGDAPTSQDALAACDYASAYLKAGGPVQDPATPYLLRRTRMPGGTADAGLPYLLSR